MTILLIDNAQAGSADAFDVPAALTELGCVVRHAPFDEALELSADRGLAREAQPNVTRVVVAGGDGSLGPAARIAHHLDVPLGIVPTGTANDFARAMRIPEDLAAACVLAGAGRELRDVDLGEACDRPFLNLVAIGVAPEAARHARRLKPSLRSLAYPVGALVATFRRRSIGVVATADGDVRWSGRAWQLIIAGTGAFGGWADTGATVDGDGKLDVLIVPATRDSRQMALDAAALLRGDLAEQDGIVHVRVERIEVVATRCVAHAVIDGEVVQIDGRRIAASADPRPVSVVVGA